MDNICITENFCLWEDLLGFGKPLYENNWDLTSEDVLKNIIRLQQLEDETLNISNAFIEKVFTLNDGFVRIFDIPQNSVMMLLMWFENSILSFQRLNRLDLANGFYGVRGVLAYGKRAIYSCKRSVGLGEYIQTSPQRKAEYNKTKVVNAPSELQMNMAFSKAYIIENSGKARGVKGNHLFIDIEVLEKLCDIINNIGFDKIGLTTSDEEENGALYYNYKAELISDKSIFKFNVHANTGKYNWCCFSISFDNFIEYSNEPVAIQTKLLVPANMLSAYTSPHEDRHDYYDLN